MQRVALILTLFAAWPAPAEEKLDDCVAAPAGSQGCRIIPAAKTTDKLLMDRVPASEPLFADASGPDWSVSRACKKGKDGLYTLTLQDLCSAARQTCLKAYGVEDCESGENKMVRRRRFWNRERREKAYPMATRLIEGRINDPKLLDQCCGRAADACEREVCGDYFKKVRVNYIYAEKRSDANIRVDLKDVDATMHVRYASFLGHPQLDHSVCIDEGRPPTTLVRQDFEKSSLHELGHACEMSRWIAESMCKLPPAERTKQDMGKLTDPLDRCFGSTAEIAERHLKELVGEQTTRCIKNRLFDLASTNPKNSWGQSMRQICTGVWLKEAYADSVFTKNWTSLAHWAPTCVDQWINFIDMSHGPARITFECLFQNQSFVDALCSGGGTPTASSPSQPSR